MPLRAPALASLMAALLAVAADGQDRVLLLVSGGPEAYRRAEAGVRAALAARGSSIEVQVVPAEDAQAALAGKPDAVVAVGAKAAEVAQRAGARPLVYAMVLDPRALGLPAPGDPAQPAVSGVSMDVAAARQFETFRRLLPAARTIGVLHDPAVSGPAVRAAAAAARSQGLDLRVVPVRDEGEVLAQARLLLPQVDAVWAMADPVVLTPANARALILLSLRSGKPVLAVSDGFVRSGALAALSADPEAVGRRAGEVALSLLDAPPGRALPAEPPPRVSLSINVATAKNLSLVLSPEILREADGLYPRSTP